MYFIDQQINLIQSTEMLRDFQEMLKAIQHQGISIVGCVRYVLPILFPSLPTKVDLPQIFPLPKEHIGCQLLSSDYNLRSMHNR